MGRVKFASTRKIKTCCLAAAESPAFPRWVPTQTAVSVDFLIWEMGKITGRFTRLENVGELCLYLCSKQMKSLLSCCVSSILWFKTTNPVALQIENNNSQPTRKNLKESYLLIFRNYLCYHTFPSYLTFLTASRP